LHKLSKQFGKEYPESVKRTQKWDEIHCGTLAGTKLHPEDIAVFEDADHYGVLHGDLNTSNIHYVDDKDHLSVYDTDQVQVGYYLFDIAQACFTIVMLDEGGMPPNGAKVEGLNRQQFLDWIVEGY
jgi:aminoglycoside phosphotransferase (APT) family kinase protein